MAKIRVYRDEAHGEEFPPLCVKCGGEEETTTTQRFVWVPQWVIVIILFGLLPWLIVMLILRKTMRLTMPMCNRHRNHWRNRKLYVWLGLLFWVVYGIALIVEWNDLPKDASSLALGILIFGGLGWLISAAIYSNSGIKPAEITDRYLELVGVNKAFAREWNASVSKPKKKPKYEDDEEE